MPTKQISDLAIGDMIRFIDPPSTGRVTGIDQSQTEIRSLRGKFGDAIMIRYTVRDGKFRGMSCTGFAHPDDRIELA